MKLLGIILMMLTTQIALCQLKINEYSAHKGVIDDGDETDWIEIINTGASDIQLSDYYLSDDINNVYQWNFPERIMLPNEILLICASNKNITNTVDHWESVVLAENNWQYFLGDSEPPADWNVLNFDDTGWMTGFGGFGYGDADDNTIINPVSSIYLRQEFMINDINDINSIVLHADYDDGYVAYMNGIEISRSENLLGNPPAYDQYTETDHEAGFYQGMIPQPIQFDQDDFIAVVNEGTNVLSIQLHNANAFSSDMTGIFYLSTGIISSTVNNFPIPAWFNSEQSNQYYHTNFKLDVGEYVIISDAATTIDLDPITDDIGLGITRGRSPDGTGPWCFFDIPSPDATNGSSWCFEGVTAAPEFSLESGWYDGSQSTSLVGNNSTVHFTTNGNIPDENDQIYSNLINLDETSIISARAFSNDNLLPSAIVDRTYIFGQDNHDLPVFSIKTDSINLWGFNEGIYVSGPNPDNNYPFYGSNFWEPWSKYARIEYFNGDKVKLAEEHLDLEIHGGWSRAEPQKSFRLDFKSSYTGRLEVPLFSQKPEITDFNNLNLRNGGQHLDSDKIQDGLISRMVNQTHIDNMAFQSCIVYLNGVYWGVYGIREKIDEHYVESNHGFPSNEVDLLNPNGVLAGTDEHIIESYLAIIAEPATSDEFYGLADSRFDLKNYMDYFIVETFIQNTDWMGIAWGLNNIKMWHPQTDNGKWRYVLYDTDGGMSSFGSSVNENYLAQARNPSVPSFHSEILDKFLDNEKIKCEFSSRYADLMNTIFQVDSVQAHIDDIVDDMAGAMPNHISRWGVPNSVFEWEFWTNTKSEFVEDRLPHARSHVNSNLNLGGQVDITLDVNPPGAGKIKISTITPPNYPWTGVYFDGCMVRLQAIANEGYVFDSWSQNVILGDVSTQQTLDLNLFQDDIFTANFITAVGTEELDADRYLTVSPNPSSGIFNLNYLADGSKDMTLSVYNSIGELVSYKNIGKVNGHYTTTIDLSHLSKSVYTLIINSNGSTVKQKLVLR
ncbi:MAG: hypothetical protein ACI8XB_000895 [Patiriisocius sp.]|jgi:hypothetical protein